MRVIILLALHITTLCRMELYDNTGSVLFASPVTETVGNVRSDEKLYRHLRMFNFDTQPSEYPTTDYINADSSQYSQFLKPLKNVCIGNKTNLTDSQKLQNFKSGICEAVVVIPALMSTKLMIRINCAELKDNHPDIFANCGWKSCNSKFSKFLGNSPQQQYILWVGVNLMFTPLVKHGLERKCFGDLMSTTYDKVTKTFSPIKGTNITWFGNTDSTRQYSNCGNNGITNVAGYSRFVRGKCEVKGQLRLIESLKVMGYQSGITLQSVPYDWRPSLEDSDTGMRIVKAIRHVYNITGKKVVVVAHSMGGNHALHALAYFMDKSQKDKMVREMYTVGAPFGGSAATIRMIAAGQSDLFTMDAIGKWNFGVAGRGINFYTQKKMAATAGFIMDTLIRPSSNYKYWEIVDKRFEHQTNTSKDNPYSWYPALWECEMCRIGEINYHSRTPVITIDKDFKYFATETDYEQLFTMLSSDDDPMVQLYRKRMNYPRNLDQMPHPLVNVSLLYSNMFSTEMSYKLPSKQQLLQKHKNQRDFVEQLEIINGLGDSTVLAGSSLFFVPEWTKNKEYAITMILYSGTNYTDPELAKLYPNLKIIPTECNSTKGLGDEYCKHGCMVNDKYIVQSILNLITNNMRGYIYNDYVRPAPLKDEQIKHIQKQCACIR